jgi:hypothetical protein
MGEMKAQAVRGKVLRILQAIPGLKGRDTTAQGKALGRKESIKGKALKERDCIPPLQGFAWWGGLYQGSALGCRIPAFQASS